MTYKRFPAKVLLFGEHFLLRGAAALSAPVLRFYGHWAWADPNRATPVQGRLREFAQSNALKSVDSLEHQAFANELSRGLWFRSIVPNGYGLGSSGVLCAAVYDRYCREKSEDPAVLKQQLANIELFFHGKSSGIDPLTSYLGCPILVKDRDQVAKAQIPNLNGKLEVYLFDTRTPRHSAPVIQRFLTMCENPAFAEKLDQFVAETHNPMVTDFLAGDLDQFWQNLAQESEFQWNNMRFMIPESAFQRWKKGMETGDYFMKICGGGGGGFMLLFSRNREASEFLCRLHRMTKISI